MNNRNRLIAFGASLLASSMLVAHAAPTTAKHVKTPVAHTMTAKRSHMTSKASVRTSKTGKRSSMSKTLRVHRKISKRHIAKHK